MLMLRMTRVERAMLQRVKKFSKRYFHELFEMREHFFEKFSNIVS